MTRTWTDAADVAEELQPEGRCACGQSLTGQVERAGERRQQIEMSGGTDHMALVGIHGDTADRGSVSNFRPQKRLGRGGGEELGIAPNRRRASRQRQQ